MKVALIALLGLTLAGGTLHAQAPATAQPQGGRQTAPAQPAQPQGGRQTAPATQAPRPATPQPPALPVNVRIDLALVDEGGASPKREMVSLTTTDRESAYARSGAMVREVGNVRLNVDATPFVSGVPAGKVRLRLTLDYWPPGIVAGTATPTQLQVTVLLDDGKPMVVSDTTDPATERRIRVEVTATILK